MRVLLDENLDRLLAGEFSPDYDVMTVQQCGWAGMKNGELLRAAERSFDVFVTMDRNLEHQQSLALLDMIVVILRARSNAFAVIAPLVPALCAALHVAVPGQVVHIPD